MGSGKSGTSGMSGTSGTSGISGTSWSTTLSNSSLEPNTRSISNSYTLSKVLT